MVKLPSLSRRRATTPSGGRERRRPDRRPRRAARRRAYGRGDPDQPGGRPEHRRPSSSPVVSDRNEDRTTYPSEHAAGRTDVRDVSEQHAADRAATARAAVTRPKTDTGAYPVVADRTDRTDGTATDRTVETAPPAVTPEVEREPEVVVDRGPRPRASMLATLSLILGVVGVLFVLTGTLAGYGIGVGAVGALLAVGGLAATRRRHVAGKSDSLLGLVLGLGAVVLGVLALTGRFDWPNTDGDSVQRFREWLDAQFANRF